MACSENNLKLSEEINKDYKELLRRQDLIIIDLKRTREQKMERSKEELHELLKEITEAITKTRKYCDAKIYKMTKETSQLRSENASLNNKVEEDFY